MRYLLRRKTILKLFNCWLSNYPPASDSRISNPCNLPLIKAVTILIFCLATFIILRLIV